MKQIVQFWTFKTHSLWFEAETVIWLSGTWLIYPWSKTIMKLQTMDQNWVKVNWTLSLENIIKESVFLQEMPFTQILSQLASSKTIVLLYSNEF